MFSSNIMSRILAHTCIDAEAKQFVVTAVCVCVCVEGPHTQTHTAVASTTTTISITIFLIIIIYLVIDGFSWIWIFDFIPISISLSEKLPYSAERYFVPFRSTGTSFVLPLFHMTPKAQCYTLHPTCTKN